MSSVRIRPADPKADRAAMLSFIYGLQEFEFTVEPNRRLDATVAADHMAVLEKRLAVQDGAIFIAEDAGTPVGWAVVHEQVDDIFVVEAERRYAYIAELYLVAAARGTGLGRDLIARCEAWAKERGFAVMQIGVLAGNGRAAEVYRRAGYADYAIQLRKYLR